MCYVRGQAHMKLGDIEKAKGCFKEALLVDVKCYNVRWRSKTNASSFYIC
jgi:tetratricopeptide (TPR) repeat protein